jgi:parallel beta-helix repeat protein
MPGTYVEHVVIDKSGVSLSGAQSILSGSNIGGAGIGLHILGSAEAPLHSVSISGFTVEDFERGIALENTVSSRVVSNEPAQQDKNPEDGAFNNADGLVLIGSDFNFIARNLVHDNGHNGIFLISGSSGNVLRGNRVRDNGAQTGDAQAGCGIQLSNGIGPASGNILLRNEALGNGLSNIEPSLQFDLFETGASTTSG